VRVGETHAFPRESVEVRRLELAALAVAFRLAVAEIVEENKDDVRPRRVGGGGLCDSLQHKHRQGRGKANRE
jgi:hypothetical protein